MMSDFDEMQEEMKEEMQDNKVSEERQAEDNKKANILCAISLGCELLPLLVATVLSPIMSSLKNINIMEASASELVGELASALSSFFGLAGIAGFAIMIYVRIKYPSNVFGKVLMVLYIVVLVLLIIGLIIVCIACVSAFNSCCSQCQNMPGILHTLPWSAL